jgi:hypothetical protein
MDPFRKALGIVDDTRRMYEVSEAHVTEAEYEAATVFHSVVYGPDGLTKWLGPAWDMIQDPRFTEIDICFYRERMPVFGGNASIGVEKISETGVIELNGSEGALQEYATIVGEGRYFVKILGAEEARKVKDWSDDKIWTLIARECPNYRDKKGNWNNEAKTLFALFKKDMLGLIADYTPHALCEDFIAMDTREVVTNTDWTEEGTPIVHVEVDSLERAIAFRNQLRVTAYRVMRNTPGVEELLQEPLTPTESDQLLRLIFSIPYRELYRLPLEVKALLTSFGVGTCPLEQREQLQVAKAKAAADEIRQKVESGEIEIIRTPVNDDHDEGLSEDEKKIRMLLSSPVLMDLFQSATAAERAGNTEAMSLLEKVLDGKQEITDEDAEKIRSLIVVDAGVTTVEGSYDGNVPTSSK